VCCDVFIKTLSIFTVCIKSSDRFTQSQGVTHGLEKEVSPAEHPFSYRSGGCVCLRLEANLLLILFSMAKSLQKIVLFLPEVLLCIDCYISGSP
jgi:hypothetical protein